MLELAYKILYKREKQTRKELQEVIDSLIRENHYMEEELTRLRNSEEFWKLERQKLWEKFNGNTNND